MSERAQNFKLLAIRPLKGCSEKYRGNLKEGQLFQFYSQFRFDPDKSGNYLSIVPTGSDCNLFNEFVSDEKLHINVSAVVGKNGSGKSTLVELFYLCCYLVAVTRGMIEIDPKSKDGITELEELEEIKKHFKVEIYFQVKEAFRCAVVGNDVSIGSAANSNIEFFNVLDKDSYLAQDFFYSTAVNYSLYGLNEKYVGKWVGRLFHKNDGYQTPMVINPFRDRGTINMERETLFAQSRLISNLRFLKTRNFKLIPDRAVKEVEFIIRDSSTYKSGNFHISDIVEFAEKAANKGKVEFFKDIFSAITGTQPAMHQMENSAWEEFTVDYVIAKVVRIAENYFKKDFHRTFTNEYVPGIKNVSKLLKALADDHSHITLKLRQAINFFRHDILRVANDSRIRVEKDRIVFPVTLFAERMESIGKKFPTMNSLEFLPISVFPPRIVLEGDFKFHRLSSGEQQYIHSIQGVIYHMLNVNSVFGKAKDSIKLTYDRINIIFDEIELYFHPEFQRRFVLDFLKSISGLPIPNIDGINILFLTHSPFILSDIPAVNVLRLKDGDLTSDPRPTFAANVHTLLADSFFMESTVGEFARYELQEIIKFHQRVVLSAKSGLDELWTEYSKLQGKFNFIVEQVGEEVISGVVKNHLHFIESRLLKPDQAKQALKMRLEKEKSALEERIRDLE